LINIVFVKRWIDTPKWQRERHDYKGTFYVMTECLQYCQWFKH